MIILDHNLVGITFGPFSLILIFSHQYTIPNLKIYYTINTYFSFCHNLFIINDKPTWQWACNKKGVVYTFTWHIPLWQGNEQGFEFTSQSSKQYESLNPHICLQDLKWHAHVWNKLWKTLCWHYWWPISQAKQFYFMHWFNASHQPPFTFSFFAIPFN